MAIWKKSYKFFAKRIRSPLRRLKIKIKHRKGWLGIPVIMTYRSFGNKKAITVRGCVLEDKGIEKAEHNNTIWENMVAMFKRYLSDQIPGVKVLIRINNEDKILTTDENGMFETTIEYPANNSDHAEWIKYNSELISDVITESKKITAEGEVYFPNVNANFGIISDIDDTILVSHATQTLRKLQLMLLRNAYTRKPFPGIAAFYRSLHKGPGLDNCNPIFYVSSSEWNLYDLLDDFCSFNKFPKGVFMLREMDTNILKFWKSGRGNHNHKYDKIKKIFETYPAISFVLVGDNGQHDPQIYSQIAKEYPGRVKAIYIRSIVKKKRKQINDLIEEMKKLNIDLLMVKNTFEAAIHAFKNNLIPKASLSEISMDVYKDKKRPGEIENMLRF